MITEVVQFPKLVLSHDLTKILQFYHNLEHTKKDMLITDELQTMIQIIYSINIKAVEANVDPKPLNKYINTSIT